MSRPLTEAPLTTRNARSKLAVGVHWRGIDPEVHLGYRKGVRGGSWLVRWRVGVGYQQERLGTADDEISEGTLDFNAAVKKAREKIESVRASVQASVDGAAPTVRSAIEHYVAQRDVRHRTRTGRMVRSDGAYRLERYLIGREAKGNRKAIPPADLADEALHELREEDLSSWRDALPASLKMSSRQRLTNDVKAALNSAGSRNRSRLPPNFLATVKHGLVSREQDYEAGEDFARESQILSDAIIGAVIAAAHQVDIEDTWDGDFHRLIVVLAATGARFSQVVRLRVADVQPDKRRLMIPVSRKGKGKSTETTPVPVAPDVMALLEPVIAKREPNDSLLLRWRHRQLKGGIKWEREARGPWSTPSEIVRSWDRIRQKTGLGKEVVPYALRHSSIVRGIRSGLPIRLVAALHDTSVAMIERHYARWIAHGLEDLAASAVVSLMPHGSPPSE